MYPTPSDLQGPGDQRRGYMISPDCLVMIFHYNCREICPAVFQWTIISSFRGMEWSLLTVFERCVEPSKGYIGPLKGYVGPFK